MTCVGSPTEVQRQAWPVIAGGDHALLVAPTGSGKTLAAFLWALNQLITARWPAGATRVLYVSPLKALNTDIRHNLSTPLAALQARFDAAGDDWPPIRVLTRSGDTPQHLRRKMLRQPPDILSTTPESLNLLLATAGGRDMLAGVRSVILDEIHAVVDTLRGVHLMTAVERLARLAGEFQRVAMSATVNPPETVAAFVGGFRARRSPSGVDHAPRPVRVIDGRQPPSLQLDVCWAGRDAAAPPDKGLWETLAARVRTLVLSHRATLVFVNSRRLCEKLTRLINLAGPGSDAEAPLAYAHHGSLAHELRRDVEERLRRGRLRAIVATGSLELGIDVGELDLVVMVQSPPSVAATLQRLGRAGHALDRVSRGILFATHPLDLLTAAVLVEGVREAAVAPCRPPLAPLDVLAQVLVGMAAEKEWLPDDLFDQVRTCYSYRHLPRRHFDRVVAMLTGRYQDRRVRQIVPRLALDLLTGRLVLRKGALLHLMTSGGTIPDRGYYQLRHAETHARIGELDEEFVWEAAPGQVLTFGTQNWRIRRITHSDVLALPHAGSRTTPPFWRAETPVLDDGIAASVADLLDHLDGRLDDPDLPVDLARSHGLDDAGARRLVAFLTRQRRRSGTRLPGRRHVVVETVPRAPGSPDGTQVVLHAPWGGRVTQPLALALAAAWESRYDQRPDIFCDDFGLVVMLPQGGAPGAAGELLDLVTPETLEPLLRRRLETSGFFAARFRECAARALLITRGRPHQRQPLWLSRRKAHQLLQAAAGWSDFPVLLETWRTCLKDHFNIGRLSRLLTEVADGTIRCSTVELAAPSPMATQRVWSQINTHMYQADQGLDSGPSNLDERLVAELVRTSELRPRITPAVVERFEATCRRLAPGYAPSPGVELVEWVKDCVVLSDDEWRRLVSAVARDHACTPVEVRASVEGRVRALTGGTGTWWTAADMAGDVASAFHSPHGATPNETCLGLLGQWFTHRGPVDPADLPSLLGMDRRLATEAVAVLEGRGDVIAGRLIAERDAALICDADNYGHLLRLQRAARRLTRPPRAASCLAPLLADRQRVAATDGGVDGVLRVLERLEGFYAAAPQWEGDLLPARLKGYEPAWLDSALQQQPLLWLGSRRQRLAFVYGDGLDLVQPAVSGDDATDSASPAQLFVDPHASYSLTGLMSRSGLASDRLMERLWQWAWQGRVTCDTFWPVRHGVERRFRFPAPAAGGPSTVNGGYGARRGSRRPHGRRRPPPGGAPPGHWRLVPPVASADTDALARDEQNRERVLLLLDRYGVLFRQLLEREGERFNWREVFPVLRRMELSGEVIGGQFVAGPDGPQFATPEALQRLDALDAEERVFWLNAADPASVCGLGITGLPGGLPPRSVTNHVVFQGARLVMVSRRMGNALDIRVPPDHGAIPTCLDLMEHLAARANARRTHLRVEFINGANPAASPYMDLLKTRFQVLEEPGGVTVYRTDL